MFPDGDVAHLAAARSDHGDSSMASGFFRDGVLVADRHGRRVVAVQDPEDGATIYVTPSGRILARDQAPLAVAAPPSWLRGGHRLLLTIGIGFWASLLALGCGAIVQEQDIPDRRLSF